MVTHSRASSSAVCSLTPCSTRRCTTLFLARAAFSSSTSKAVIAPAVVAISRSCRWHDSTRRSTIGSRNAPVPQEGSTITIEPWRAGAFPVVRDLVVDRSAFDRIMHAGGYVTVHAGPKPDPNAMPIEPEVAELALDAATCIGCGACVAACPNGAAMLYTAAKVSHLGLLPQGQPERYARVVNMVRQMETEGFGSCRNYGECEASCPKQISISFISRMNRDYLRATLIEPVDPRGSMDPQ